MLIARTQPGDVGWITWRMTALTLLNDIECIVNICVGIMGMIKIINDIKIRRKPGPENDSGPLMFLPTVLIKKTISE